MTPFYQHLPGIPGLRGATGIDKIGGAAVLGVGAAFAGHGLIQIMKRVGNRVEPIAPKPKPPAPTGGRAVMSRVVVDPVTRIEGHLRIEAEVDGGAVKDAWSSSTMFRGIEIILKGRDPRDAWAFAQRICGVCTTVHAIASIRAVENAIGADAAAQRAAAAQPDHGGAGRPGPRRPLLPPARARLGRHRLGALGRSGEDVGAGRVDLRLAALEPEVLRRRPRSHQGVRRARPARAVRQRLLGAPGLPAARRKRT